MWLVFLSVRSLKQKPAMRASQHFTAFHSWQILGPKSPLRFSKMKAFSEGGTRRMRLNVVAHLSNQVGHLGLATAWWVGWKNLKTSPVIPQKKPMEYQLNKAQLPFGGNVNECHIFIDPPILNANFWGGLRGMVWVIFRLYMY